jgi:hypothetical protein
MDEFLTLTFTKKDALRRVRVIKDLLNIYFFDTSAEKKFVKSVASLEKKYATNEYYRLSEPDLVFIERLGQAFFDNFNPARLELEMKQLQQLIDKAKMITIYMPFEPDQQTVDRIGEYIKQNFGVSTLFAPSFDPGLVGGCLISFNGNMKDYSLRQQIFSGQVQINQVVQSFKAKAQ